jgi:lipopolysaccharide transport system permease protein
MSQLGDPASLRVIEASPGRVRLDLAELWEYRELLGFLVWRDVKVRYKQTALGAAWAIIQPLTSMVVFSLLFGRWAGMPSDGVPYPLFAFAGLIPWTFVANAVAASANSLVGNGHLISKVYFPRLLISLASIGAALVDLAIALLLMTPLLLFYGIALTWQVAAVPALLVLTVLIAVAVGSVLAAMCAVYRDVRYVVPFLLQFWMFASPVIYPVALIPEGWRWIAYLNPVVGAVDGFRSALLGRPFAWTPLAVAAGVAAAAACVGVAYFRRVERRVVDLV